MMDIGTKVMAHRYLYYVLTRPVIDDHAYDQLEKLARDQLPFDHPVHRIGSDVSGDYSDEVKLAAGQLLKLLAGSES